MEVKREVNDKGTVYSVLINGVRIHEEYCLSSANRVFDSLSKGKRLVDLVEHPELRKLKEELVNVKAENANLKKENVALSAEKDSLNALLNMFESGDKSVSQYRVEKITGLPAPVSLNELDSSTFNEILAYVTMFVQLRFKEHWQVNNLISKMNSWNQYPNIRSINTHRNGKEVEGIYPEYYALVCEILNIMGDNGTPLVHSRRY
ncbi:hypothetical protein [Aliivibrio fischeri]|uniref:hypothetical protein n=1 Tax=Aliivibrio fischeri TaxID=668 RepID=UPI001F4604AE|nr:hypothetical protein [Aliivibrio fischeri]MCE7556445.1 hypothetical protein [Aliivibrio fischeri]MCE7562990.1 hypothetical protein [Aliivibrio fischeri]MCE7571282.1 hypothetical protein [Aliivibrio fischeri]